MTNDPFLERLVVVRQRFAHKLTDRIAEIDAALTGLVGEGESVPDAVSTAHRTVHNLCGIGPTLGFTATGTAARVCERILLQPSRAQRGLTQQEMASLKEGLAGLWTAARTDMQTATP
jgi:HPt (histidine-containing phosphotransfer) domain-containing protein